MEGDQAAVEGDRGTRHLVVESPPQKNPLGIRQAGRDAIPGPAGLLEDALLDPEEDGIGAVGQVAHHLRQPEGLQQGGGLPKDPLLPGGKSQPRHSGVEEEKARQASSRPPGAPAPLPHLPQVVKDRIQTALEKLLGGSLGMSSRTRIRGPGLRRTLKARPSSRVATKKSRQSGSRSAVAVRPAPRP